MDYDYEDLADEYDVEDYGIEPSKSEYSHEGYSENISLRPPLYELFYHCLTPTVGEAAAHLGKVLFYCVVFRLVCDYGPKRLKNLTSIGCGIMVTYHFFGPLTWYLAANATISYLVLQVSTVVLNRGRGVLTAVTSVVFLFLCELFIVASQDWHTIRGAQMLISMKVISIGFDIDSNHLLSVPMPMDFFGYIFCVGTIIFGPWTRFSDYAMIGHNKLGIIHNILVTSWKSAVALFFLSISTCWSFWIAPNGSYKWSVAYRDALSFRSSHYFVSKMAEASSLTCNILQSKVKGAKKDDKKYENDSVSAEPIVITRPWSIELPRSLVEVVVHWNIPMHHWLRTYVFKNTRSLGTLPAILSTYAASAMLHGLNFQLAAVLFSLGIYTYTEHIFRTKLAFMINGCVGPRKCSDCTHALKESHFVVMIINFCFSLIVMFHLAYLGFMFNSAGSMEEEGYSMYHTLEKWRWLNFSSHWVVLFTFILASVM